MPILHFFKIALITSLRIRGNSSNFIAPPEKYATESGVSVFVSRVASRSKWRPCACGALYRPSVACTPTVPLGSDNVSTVPEYIREDANSYRRPLIASFRLERVKWPFCVSVMALGVSVNETASTCGSVTISPIFTNPL
jgi:hypothetical protein